MTDNTKSFTEKHILEKAVTGHQFYDEILEAIRYQHRRRQRLPALHPTYTIGIDSTTGDSYVGTDLKPEQRAQAYAATLSKMLKETTTPGRNYTELLVTCRNNNEGPAYTNAVHNDGKALICVGNFSSRDPLRQAKSKHLMYWADLMAISIQRAMTRTGGSPKNLETIWRVHIIIDDTRGVIDYVTASLEIKEKKQESFELTPDSEYFFALLATTHRKGPARMLATYPYMFGRKIFSKVQVWPWGYPYLCWFLEVADIDVPDSPPPLSERSTLSRKEQRHLKRSSQN